MQQKLKVLMMGVLFTLFTQSAFAIDVYWGGAVGVGSYDGKRSISNSVTGQSFTSNHGGTSFIGGGLLGAEYTFCDGIYSAIELNALYNSFDTRTRDFNPAGTTGLFSTKIKNDFIYGADLKLGLNTNCAIPYLVVGVSAARWQINSSNSTAASVFGLPAGASRSFSKTRVGPKFGFGVRFAAWNCWDLDFQYSFTWFGKHSRTVSDPAVTVPALWTHSNRHDQHRFLISLNSTFFCF